MCPQTSVGTVSSERQPELVAEHRDAVAGMLVVPGVPCVLIVTAVVHVPCLAGHLRMVPMFTVLVVVSVTSMFCSFGDAPLVSSCDHGC